MSDLSPAAREMVESHRRGRMLSQADRNRMKHELMLRVATLGATTAAAGAAMGMSLASKIVLVAVGVSAIVGGGAASFWALRGQAPSAAMPPRQAAVPSLANAPQVAQPVPSAEAAAASGDSASADTGRGDYAKKIKRPVVSAPSPAPTPVVAADPEPELRVLREAREDLRAGRPESAYRRLDEYGRLHGDGMLAQERKALLAIALCQWQPGKEAEARAAEFLRSSPESPLVSRVRLACAKAKTGQ
jgi:hypothetical protein